MPWVGSRIASIPTSNKEVSVLYRTEWSCWPKPLSIPSVMASGYSSSTSRENIQIYSPAWVLENSSCPSCRPNPRPSPAAAAAMSIVSRRHCSARNFTRSPLPFAWHRAISGTSKSLME